MRSVKAHWHREANFGDRLTPWLLAKHGIQARWARPNRAEFFGVGSIGARIPRGFTGTVWGTGLIKAGQTAHVEDARVLALRGPLTGEAPLYGDPGLLCGLYAPEAEKRYETGVLPHYIEDLPHEGQRLNIRWDVETLIEAATKCQRIVSSSLHGLILADSLGISNMWVYSDRVIGKGWKFKDYAASFGETIEPDVWRLAPQDQVADKQAALLDTLKGLSK
jgi:pyruvyltransferase